MSVSPVSCGFYFFDIFWSENKISRSFCYKIWEVLNALGISSRNTWFITDLFIEIWKSFQKLFDFSKNFESFSGLMRLMKDWKNKRDYPEGIMRKWKETIV